MPKRLWLPALGAVLLCGGAARAAGAQDPNPRLIVRIINDTALAERKVGNALMIAGGVYRRAGIAIEWTGHDGRDDSTSVLAIRLVERASDAPFQTADDSMGVARSPDRGRGLAAYVFLDRVRDFAERGHVDAWMVLGCAIAHELGHVLLPVNSHAGDG